MKLEIKNDIATLVASNKKESVRLIGIYMDAPQLKLRTTAIIPKGHNAWKGKHKIKCETCGKRFKNMKLHVLLKHKS